VPAGDNLPERKLTGVATRVRCDIGPIHGQDAFAKGRIAVHDRHTKATGCGVMANECDRQRSVERIPIDGAGILSA
jgi:hypothetical protein